MSGWNRIGVVLSVIWATVIVAYSIYEYITFPIEPFISYTYRPENAIYSRANKFTFIKIREIHGQQAKSAEELAIYEKYIREATTDSDRKFMIEVRDSSEYSSGVAWSELLSAIFIPIVLAWCLVTVICRVVVWVRNGFIGSS